MCTRAENVTARLCTLSRKGGKENEEFYWKGVIKQRVKEPNFENYVASKRSQMWNRYSRERARKNKHVKGRTNFTYKRGGKMNMKRRNYAHIEEKKKKDEHWEAFYFRQNLYHKGKTT